MTKINVKILDAQKDAKLANIIMEKFYVKLVIMDIFYGLKNQYA